MINWLMETMIGRLEILKLLKSLLFFDRNMNIWQRKHKNTVEHPDTEFSSSLNISCSPSLLIPLQQHKLSFTLRELIIPYLPQVFSILPEFLSEPLYSPNCFPCLSALKPGGGDHGEQRSPGDPHSVRWRGVHREVGKNHYSGNKKYAQCSCAHWTTWAGCSEDEASADKLLYVFQIPHQSTDASVSLFLPDESQTAEIVRVFTLHKK